MLPKGSQETPRHFATKTSKLVEAFTKNWSDRPGFWGNSGLVDGRGQRAPPRPRKMLKKPSVFKHFQKKWCWRSSPVVCRSSFCRMLQLICLFLLQNALGSLGTPWGLLGSPWDPFGTPSGPLGIRSMDPIYGPI